jgi:outer membrane receptor protein involved in Fe transport
VTIERVGAAAIKTAPATNYYDILANLKGVDVTAASLTFKSISTRGFNGSGNTRMNQLIDGMDNQAPGLNFAVGSVIGLTELDVDNIELLSGASSALYGSGGMNGTVLINSKNPFKYQGLSFQIKQGINHVDNYQRPQAAYKDYSVRFAKVVEDRLAYKIGVQYTEAQDWLANDKGNYSRTTGTPNGQSIAGDRYSDPNFDGVNIYGDETTQSLSSVNASILAGVKAAAGALYTPIYTASQAYLGANPGANLAAYNTFLKAAGGTSLVNAGYSTFLYGDIRKIYNGINVSRTGYEEANVIDPTTKNVKFTGAVHYKLTDDVEASVSAYMGQGNTVYTGSDRYSLKDLQMSQFKFELKAKDWYFRAYKTVENSGNSFNATIASRYFNEVINPSTSWYPTYMAAYTAALEAGANQLAAHQAARNTADVGRPVRSISDDPRFQKIIGTPISQGGAQFLDKTVLNVVEGQYNLTTLTGLDKYDADLMVGASVKQYVLNSQGTLFADTLTKIWINEIGSYTQLSKKFFGDFMKVSVSGRYDKSDFFKGRFTPRISSVFKIAEDNNLRVSYQSAYRFPTTQNQFINLLVGGGTRLMGGVQQLQDFYKFDVNRVYTLASVQAFGAQAALGNVNPNLLQRQVFGTFKPESMTSFEVGYKTLIAKKLLIDAYVYAGNYKNFISGVTVLQSTQAVPSVLDLLDAKKRMVYSISTNAQGNVKTSGWGVSADYILPRNFSVTGSVYSDIIGDLPAGFISYFNTPKLRANFAINNSGFLLKNKLGFSANLHYQEGFVYEGTFAVGKVSAFNTIDAVLTYKVPEIKSLIKVGGTNIMNHYYRTAYGSPAIGGLYYVSFAYNIL